MNKNAIRTSNLQSNLNLPAISSPRRKHDQYFEKIVYKKFFIPNVLEEIRIPPFEYQLSIEKPYSNYHDKVAAYKKYTNGRINCVSVIPHRDSTYVSKQKLKQKLKINVDLPKLKFLCRTPMNDNEIITPLVNSFVKKHKVVESTKNDAMINTD